MRKYMLEIKSWIAHTRLKFLFQTIVIIFGITILITPPIYSMDHAIPASAETDPQPPIKPSCLQKYFNPFAETFIDPMAGYFLPIVNRRLNTQYHYHVKGQDQQPFKSQYTIGHKSQFTDRLRHLMPLKANYPDYKLRDDLLIDEDGLVYSHDGQKLMGKQRPHHIDDIHVCRDKDHDTDVYDPGKIFLYKGMLIERFRAHTSRGNRYYDYHADKQLCLQIASPHIDSGYPESCFKPVNPSFPSTEQGRPFVDKKGKPLYVKKISRHYDSCSRQNTYPTTVGSDLEGIPPFNSEAGELVRYYPSGATAKTFIYLKDCVDTVKLYPNRARLYFMSALTSALSLSTYSLLRLYRKLIKNNNTANNTADNATKVSTQQKIDRDNQNKSDNDTSKNTVTQESIASSPHEQKTIESPITNNVTSAQRQDCLVKSQAHNKIASQRPPK